MEGDARYDETWREYYSLVQRSGGVITQTLLREAMRTHQTLITTMMLRRGAVKDAMLCGTSGAFSGHVQPCAQGYRPMAGHVYA